MDIGSVRSLADGDVAVHWFSTDVAPGVVAAMKTLLNPAERARANRLRIADAHNAFVVTRSMLRVLLGRYLGAAHGIIEFEYGRFGKPRLVDTELGFSVSHSAGIATVALAPMAQIGIDVERIRGVSAMTQIASRFFCRDEADEVLPYPDAERDRRFFRLWTCKEAYVKATGSGLATAFSSFRVSLVAEPSPRLVHIGGDAELASHWNLREWNDLPGYALSLAYGGRIKAVTVSRHLPEEVATLVGA